jgi:malate dehydrogenase (oxaloacetate-decarboxylating)
MLYDHTQVIRVLIPDKPGAFGRLATAIGHQGANMGDVRFIKRGITHNIREIEITVRDEAHLARVAAAVGRLKDMKVERLLDPVMEAHRGGKIRVASRVSVTQPSDFRRIYTPGVAAVCQDLQKHPEHARDFTWLSRNLCVATNGTAVLGLGDIGNIAGLPVMEGKCVILDQFAGLSGVPLLVNHKKPKAFIDTVLGVAQSFGAIQLEDVASPECFEIERALVRRAGRPVLHDDQHGTAVVVLAALTKACRLHRLELKDQEIGIVGLGAAGTGIARLLKKAGVQHIFGTDLKAEALKRLKTLGGQTLTLQALVKRCRIVVCTTGVPGLIKPAWVRKGQLIMALSNPQAEIEPAVALKAGAALAVDGKSVNNALAFPGLFRGVLDAGVPHFTTATLLAAANVLAKLAQEHELVPSILAPGVHEAVRQAVYDASLLSRAALPHVLS